MEITVKSVRVASSGTNDKGEWELICVTTPDGTEFTTFDKKAKHVGEGAVIDIGDPKTKKGKFSFDKVVKIVKEGQAPALGNGGGQYKADPEKIASEELRSRMHAGKDYVIAGVYKRDEPLGQLVERWIMGDITPAKPPAAKPQAGKKSADDEEWDKLGRQGEQSQGETVKGELKDLPIRNLGDLFNAAYHHYGMNQGDVLKALGGITKEQITDPKQSWLEIVEAKS